MKCDEETDIIDNGFAKLSQRGSFNIKIHRKNFSIFWWIVSFFFLIFIYLKYISSDILIHVILMQSNIIIKNC